MVVSIHHSFGYAERNVEVHLPWEEKGQLYTFASNSFSSWTDLSNLLRTLVSRIQ